MRRRDGVKGSSFTVEVWSIQGGRYGRSRTFSGHKMGGTREAERAALRWAREQVAQQRAGLAAPDRGSGVRTDEALRMYLEDRQSRGGNPTQLANVRRRLGSLAGHCPDLAADEAPRQVYGWWREWCEEPRQFGGRAGQQLRRTTDGRPKSIRTRNNGLADAKAFLSWCWKARALTGLQRPVDVDWIEPLRAEHQVKPQFSVEELARGLRLRDHPFRIRWAIYAYLGARRQEALGLRWEHFEGDHVLLSGKGRKQRLVPMQAELAAILRLYRRSGGDHDGWLFPDYVRHDDGGNLSRRFDSFLRAAEIEKRGRSTHSLRHCYAGLMTATGEPTALLQAYMGHSQSDMTMHYAQMAARYRSAVAGWPRGTLRLLRSG